MFWATSFYNALRVTIVNYYNTNVINSGAVNANTVKTEYINNSLSENTKEFEFWLSSTIVVQTSALYNSWEIAQSAIFKSIFEENDDFSNFSSDPFFQNNPDDPWRLKQYLSPHNTYLVGLLAGVGDGFIETANLATDLTKFAINNSPPVLLFHLITDFDNTIQEKLDQLETVKGFVSVIFDKVKQEQIYNAIKALTINWFEETTFQKTDVQAGYQHG